MLDEINKPTIRERLKEQLNDFTGIFLIREMLLPDVSPMSVRLELASLAKMGYIIRLARGVYYKPPVSSETHKAILPNPTDVAKIVAKKQSHHIIPCMEQSAYLTGLDGFAEKPYVWLTDATTGSLKLYKGPVLYFVHTRESRLFTFKSETMRNLSNGLRYIGSQNITEKEERIVRKHLATVSKDDFLEDLPKCPEWVRNLMISA